MSLGLWEFFWDWGATPSAGWLPGFDQPRSQAPLRAAGFGDYVPSVAIVALPPFDIPVARRAIRTPEWSFVASPASGVFTAFDAPRRTIAIRGFDAYTPFALSAVFTPQPLDVPRARRALPGFEPYSPFVPVAAALPVFTPGQLDQPGIRRGRLDATVYSPFVPVIAAAAPFTQQDFAVPPVRSRLALRTQELPFIGQIPFVGLALDLPQARRGRHPAVLAEAFVPFAPVAPPALAAFPIGDWPRRPARVQRPRPSFDFDDIGYHTDGPIGPIGPGGPLSTRRRRLRQLKVGQSSYWKGMS